MSSAKKTLQMILESTTWDHRVSAIRQIPELHGQREQPGLYAEVAQALYRPHLSPQFAFVPERSDYTLESFVTAYKRASELTANFEHVEIDQLAEVIRKAPETLLVFRTMTGYTPNELAHATGEVAAGSDRRGLGAQRVKSMESGSRPPREAALLCAETLHHLITGTLWADAPRGFRSKLDKLDTSKGWDSVRALARAGVPYEAFLHQRHMGGAFRQILDATSETRGALLEAPMETLLLDHGVAFLRTGSANQSEITTRFDITVRPAPDFVVFEPPGTLKAVIECKQANDGGTARDKAARFRALRQEMTRLGGIALFAVLDGLGWERVNDALGPVIQQCDGRVFTLKTMSEMMTVQPFPGLAIA